MPKSHSKTLTYTNRIKHRKRFFHFYFLIAIAFFIISPSLFIFPKREKLCGQIRIKNLYANGRHFTCYPLRVIYQSSRVAEVQGSDNSSIPQFNNSSNIQVLIWAPKSLFKKAYQRNRLRRQMREAYRLNALPLKQAAAAKGITFQVAFNYIAKEQLPYEKINHAMQKAIKKLCEEGERSKE